MQDHTEDLDIEAGDKLAVTVESDAVDSLNGEIEITARSGLGSETICDKPGFENETPANYISLETDGGKTLTLVINDGIVGMDDETVGVIRAPGHSDRLATVTTLEVA